MREHFVDTHCQRLPGALRTTPFGPDTVVWKVESHMFAAYTFGGQGLSLRLTGLVAVGTLMEQGRASSPDWLREGGWALLPWETHPDELRERINQSYRMVLRDLPPR